MSFWRFRSLAIFGMVCVAACGPSAPPQGAGGAGAGGAGAGGSCHDVCPDVGAIQCKDGQSRTCALQDDGCLSWGAPIANECTSAGATACSGGEVRACVADANGCLSWGEPTACPDGTCGDAMSCATCTNACAAGDVECTGGELRTCVTDANGCRTWSSPTACADGFCADASSCGSCMNECPTAGATQCSSGQIQTCAADANGCRAWSAPSACVEGFCADASSCGSCSNECPSVGATQCTGGELRTCEADANGCRAWGSPTACADGFCADAMSCGSCTNECPAAGATQCSGGQLQTCVADANGCRAWSSTTACAEGFCADAMSCGSCNNACAQAGVTSCANGAFQTCVAGANGCLGWSSASPCPGGFCADGATCGSCNNQCPAAGATMCANGALQTCVADANGCRSWSSPTPCASGCLDAQQCDPCNHECSTWGTSCAGNVLETCVVDAAGCRKLFSQTCSLGCAGAACNTCGAYQDPVLDAALDDQTGFYKDLVFKGSVALSNWQERDGQYGGSDWGLSSVDVSNPSALVPGVVSTLGVSDSARHLQLSGNRLFFLNKAGMQIYDVSNPASPVPLGSFALSDQPAFKHALSVDGNLACLATNDGVHLIDVTQSASPQQVGLYNAGVTPYQVRCVGNYAAVAGNSRVEIVNITNPASPVFVADSPAGSVSTDQSTLQFDGSTAYAVSYSIYDSQLWYSLDAYKFTPPSQLVKVGALGSIYPFPRATALQGGTLYLGNGDSVGLVDVSNPAALKWKKKAAAAEGASGIAPGAGVFFGANNGVTSYDPARISDFATLAAGSNDLLGGSAVVGSLALLARASGLVIEDIRDPKAPVVLSKTAMNATDVVVKDQLAYVTMRTSTQSWLRIYDIKSPWSPKLVGSVQGPSDGSFDSNFIGSLKLSGTRAYALCSIGYICVFEVLNPAAPTLVTKSNVIGNVAGSQSSSSVFGLEGQILYVPSYDKLYVVDFQNPTAPTTLATLTVPGSSGTVLIDVAASRVYLAKPCLTGQACFYVVDVSTPASPSIVGNASHTIHFMKDLYPVLNSSAPIDTLRVHGDRLYLSNKWGGVVALDVGDPSQPRVLTEYWTALPARRMFVVDRFLTTYTVSSFPYPAPAAQQDQVIQLCP